MSPGVVGLLRRGFRHFEFGKRFAFQREQEDVLLNPSLDGSPDVFLMLLAKKLNSRRAITASVVRLPENFDGCTESRREVRVRVELLNTGSFRASRKRLSGVLLGQTPLAGEASAACKPGRGSQPLRSRMSDGGPRLLDQLPGGCELAG